MSPSSGLLPPKGQLLSLALSSPHPGLSSFPYTMCGDCQVLLGPALAKIATTDHPYLLV